jgi:hypothetical protein
MIIPIVFAGYTIIIQADTMMFPYIIMRRFIVRQPTQIGVIEGTLIEEIMKEESMKDLFSNSHVTNNRVVYNLVMSSLVKEGFPMEPGSLLMVLLPYLMAK